MFSSAWAALAIAQPTLDGPVSHSPSGGDWPVYSTDFATPPAWPCAYGSVRSCLAKYQGAELCAAVRPLCDQGSQDACAVVRTDECACLAYDAVACTNLAKGLARGGDEAVRVMQSLENPCLAGAMTACTAITSYLLRKGAPELASGGEEASRVLKLLENPCLAGEMTACTAITRHLLGKGAPELARPWLVFTCDRGVESDCARLEALPAREGAPPEP